MYIPINIFIIFTLFEFVTTTNDLNPAANNFTSFYY